MAFASNDTAFPGTIPWDQVTGKPTTFPSTNPTSRVVIDTTTELSSDGVIVCNKATAMTVNLLGATGSNRVRSIANINSGEVTIEGNGGDTINGELNQAINSGEAITVKDYETGKWIIL